MDIQGLKLVSTTNSTVSINKKILNFDLFKVVSNESSKFFFRTDERYSSISVSNILIHKEKKANRQFGLISLDPDNE